MDWLYLDLKRKSVRNETVSGMATQQDTQGMGCMSLTYSWCETSPFVLGVAHVHYTCLGM